MKWNKSILVLVVGLLLLTIPVSLIVGAAPESGITSPGKGEAVRGEVSIQGTATDPQFWKYELNFSPDPSRDDLWTAVSGSPSTTAVVEGELGIWDTTAFPDGTYALRLRIVRQDGNYSEHLVKGIRVVNTEPEPTEEPEEPVVEPPTEEPVAEPEPTEEPVVEPTPETALGVPFLDKWVGSVHADKEAEAFRHWDEDDPPVVPAACAKCHSEGGALDFFGADGSEPRVVDTDHDIGTVITCIACHNEATMVWDTVVFPSGAEITGLGSEARCMECHQGRASTLSVDASIEEAGLEDMDTVSEDLGFTNIHYYAAAASMYGTLTKGGYEYEGKSYDAKFDHVEDFDSCVSCHSSHTLELKAEACAECHTESDPKDFRMQGSLVDYDGDGSTDEGIYYELEGLQGMLYKAMQAYSGEVAGTSIVYDSHTYPYFFIDTNGNGEADEDEVNFSNGYNAWTGRLAKAAYNYQTSLKDPGAYAHGGKYIIQLLYDSIENLNEALSEPIDLSNARRIDHGHFAGSEEAFRHWDEDDPPAVSGRCSRCHAADGLPLYATEGVEITQMPSNGLNCTTCHNELTDYAIHEFASATFPSGAEIDSGDPNTNLCMQCHQGRSSTVQVNRAIADKDPDTVDEELGFINVHYFAAGATLFGNEAQGAYQYDGKDYVGRFAHVDSHNTCTQCHSIHELEVKAEECSACHGEFEELSDIRMDSTDYDGDGDTSGGIASEIVGMRDVLYAAIQDYAADVAGTPIIYDSHSHPYFFIDTNANGESDPDEVNSGNRYATWTPRLVQAAYNYQYARKDPGASAHNAKYVLQVLYDSLEDLGGDVSGMTRP